MGCDMVLGVQWLRQVGLIVWDFTAQSMVFVVRGQWITLHGVMDGDAKLAFKRQAIKISNSSRVTCTLLFTYITQTSAVEHSTTNNNFPEDMETLYLHFLNYLKR